MSARREVTNRLRAAYRRASKKDKGRILDQVASATGLARVSARRLLAGPKLPAPSEQIDGRTVRKRRYSDAARELLIHVWSLMGRPNSKYFTVMRHEWMPLLQAGGDLQLPYASEHSIAEVLAMSAASVERYLAPVRRQFEIRGISATKPDPAMRNSITIRTLMDEVDWKPGMVEADTVVHCGSTLQGECARTLTVTDMKTGYTLNQSTRNNAFSSIGTAIGELIDAFPMPVSVFDSDNGSEFINAELIKWLALRGIEQTRSRPYMKNDQATVESKNNHIVRRYAFYYRYDTSEELNLLNQLWPLVNMKLNHFTVTRKPIGYKDQHNKQGRKIRIYDEPATPWQRLKNSKILSREAINTVEHQLDGFNPADLTRQINHIQQQLINQAKEKTQALNEAKTLDLAKLEPSIRKLAPKP